MTMRYVADMRRCQYVVQRPERVRRMQRLNVAYLDGPTRATSDPTRPSPRTPRFFPRRSVPTVCCQPPDRTELLSVTMCRVEAKISAQVNSIVGSDLYPV